MYFHHCKKNIRLKQVTPPLWITVHKILLKKKRITKLIVKHIVMEYTATQSKCFTVVGRITKVASGKALIT